MNRSILVRGARQLVTLHGRSGPRRGEQMRELGIIEDGALLIVNGVIQRVGATRQVENTAAAKAAHVINATGRVVMPGFVDSHTHLIAAPARITQSRSRSPGAGALAGSTAYMHGVQWVRGTPPSTLEFNARRYVEGALRHGTTTLEAKTGYALNGSGEMKMLRVLASLGDAVVALVPTFCGAYALPREFNTAEEYIAMLSTQMIPKLRERKIVQYVDCLCDSGGFTAEQLWPYVSAAARAGFPLKVQGDQTSHHGCVPLALDCSAVAVAGLNYIDESDVQRLARSSTVATLLPARFNDSRPAPARALLDSGAVVALASGFHPAARSTFNMQTVISLACGTMGFTPEEAITAATVNAAYAVGRGSACGTLEVERQADLLILNIEYRRLSGNSFVSRLQYRPDGNPPRRSRVP